METIPTQQVYLGTIDELAVECLDFSRYSSVFILVDENTERDCLPLLTPYLPLDYRLIQIASGEINKTIKTCQDVWTALLERGADRKSILINLGGGVIGDLGGFCAATYTRGMDFIQIPTTVLAMADASVGGKLGVDLNHIKNYIGLFQKPKAVLIDPSFLQTLPGRHIDNGMAEILKHGLIADHKFFDTITGIENWNDEQMDWQSILCHSTKIKSQIVTLDEKELGERKKLNFGHTIGHAIESAFLSDNRDLLHGEAIIIGMIAESYISTHICGLSMMELNKITQGLLSHYTKVHLDAISADIIKEYVYHDKKKTGHKVGFTLLESIGKARIDQVVQDQLIYDSLKYYERL